MTDPPSESLLSRFDVQVHTLIVRGSHFLQCHFQVNRYTLAAICGAGLVPVNVLGGWFWLQSTLTNPEIIIAVVAAMGASFALMGTLMGVILAVGFMIASTIFEANPELPDPLTLKYPRPKRQLASLGGCVALLMLVASLLWHYFNQEPSSLSKGTLSLLTSTVLAMIIIHLYDGDHVRPEKRTNLDLTPPLTEGS